MQTVVIVSPTPTNPIDFGNRKRIHRMASELKKNGFRIHFVLFALEQDWRDDFPEESYRAMKEEWDEVHVVHPISPYHKSADGEDHTIDEWWDVALEKFLWWYLRSRNVDALIVNYIYLSRALTLAHPHTLKILDTHDRFGGRRQMLAQLGIGPEFFHLDSWNEGTGIARADVVVAIKPEEQEYFEHLGAKISLTVPYSEPPKFLPSSEPDHDGYLRVGMIGGRNSINRHSTERFLRGAVSAIFASGAPIKLILAGSMCADLGAWASKFCVELWGPIDEVESFYRSIDCVVVPMEISSGQKIKTGEALGYGVPVVSTAHAFEGYVPHHPAHECPSLRELVDSLIDLAFDQTQLPRLKLASNLAAQRQEALVESGTRALLSLIRFKKPRSLILVDHSRFVKDPLFRSHLGHLLEFLFALTGMIVRFDNISGAGTSYQARSAIVQIRRKARVEYAQISIAELLATNDILFIWDYGRTATNPVDHQSNWYGLLSECANFLPSRPVASNAPALISTSSGVGQIESWRGGAGDLRTEKCKRITFPCNIYGEDQLAKCFQHGGKSDHSALFVFGAELHDLERINAVVSMLSKRLVVSNLVIVSQCWLSTEKLEAELDAIRMKIKCHVVNPEKDAKQALCFSPAGMIDLKPRSSHASFLKVAFAQMSVPRFLCEARSVSAGVELRRGKSDLELFTWLSELLNDSHQNERSSQNSRPPTHDESGFAAIFTYFKEFSELHRKRRFDSDALDPIS